MAGGAAPKKVRILLVNSYSENLPWTKSITNAVEDSIRNDRRLDCSLSVEYMDTKNIFTDEYLLKLRDIYTLKYKDTVFDAVITTDDDAFNFCVKYHGELFKGVSLVFCGVNNFEQAAIAGKNISGVVEAFDIKANLELINKIHPGAKKIYVINDKTTTGAANKVTFQKKASLFSSAFAFEYLEDLSMAEVLARVEKIEAGAVVFLMTFNRDRTGAVYSYQQSTRLIEGAAKVPMYGVWDFYLGDGITGGMMISGRSQGEAAARLASDIIVNGKKASDVPVIQTSPNRYMFDYNMLKKNGIDVSKLPENSFILNRPFSFYSIDKNIFWFIIVLVAILAVLTVFLVVSVTERRAAEKELLLVNRKLENMINELENIVEKRTRELLDSNRNLKQQVAEREKVQKELVASEARYRLLAENAFDVIFETGLDGSIIYVSPNFAEAFGVAAQDLSEVSFGSLVYEADRGSVKNMFDVIGARGYANEVIFRNAGFDVRPVWLESSGKVFTAADGRLHTVIVARDVTERRKIEEEMVRNAKLESLGILAGGIAHDFNNVLMGIIGNITLARRRCGDASISELLARAEKVSYKAKSLTEQLITFSKGGQPIKKTTDLNELIYEAVQFSLSGSSMKSEFLLDPALRKAEVDEGQLIQVITNIAINARQACGENGTVVFRTQNVENKESYCCAGAGAGGCVKLTISDNGCGIAKDDLKKIFDPYFTTKPDGRGIGLAAAHSIIKNHNGIIDVESKQGEGTSFHIYLPAS
jgi:PAS domain S-box-containing protein